MLEPRLETLTRRLADCPAEFTLELPAEEAGLISPAAVVEDVLRGLGGQALEPGELAAFAAGGKAGRRRKVLVMTGAWLLGDECFSGRPALASKARVFLLNLAQGELAEVVEPGKFVTDPDRREELARRALRALGLLPAGESAAQAEDRLAALDSVETRRTAAQAQAAQERARAVLDAMKKKAAEEAAAKASRE